MTHRLRRPDATRFAGSATGRVTAVRTGVVEVVTRGRLLRASYGGGLLADVARSPGAEPRVGDRVRLTCWADGHVTVDRVVVRAVSS